MKNERNSSWSEIVCDYLDGEGFWTVDAWTTDGDDEEGKIIAAIDDENGKVFYVDNIARTDPYAQEVIGAKVNEIRKLNEDDRVSDMLDSVGV